MQKWLLILLISLSVIIFVLLIIFLLTLYFYQYIFKRSKFKKVTSKPMANVKRLDEDEWYKNQPMEKLSITSFDNLCLNGYLLKNKESHLYVINVHGYKSKYIWSATAMMKAFFDSGYNILGINNRAHDDSDGKYFTMGYNERYDLKKWIEKIVELDNEAQIVLYGISMGAHIVMMTSVLDLPNNVKAVIEDSGYTSCDEQLKHMINQYVKFSKPLRPLLNYYTLHFKHFDTKLSTVTELKKATIPILFIHGTSDLFVPCSMLEPSFEACASYKEKEIFNDAGHCCSIAIDYDRYVSKVLSFANKFIEK